MPSNHPVLFILLRLLLLTMFLSATPRVAQADQLTRMGLERLAESVGYLAAAVAFAGIVIAAAIYLAFKSPRRD